MSKKLDLQKISFIMLIVFWVLQILNFITFIISNEVFNDLIILPMPGYLTNMVTVVCMVLHIYSPMVIMYTIISLAFPALNLISIKKEKMLIPCVFIGVNICAFLCIIVAAIGVWQDRQWYSLDLLIWELFKLVLTSLTYILVAAASFIGVKCIKKKKLEKDELAEKSAKDEQ